MTVFESYQHWLANCKGALADELAAIVSDKAAVEDAFFKEIEFGTGGLRGKLGAGTNRMNVHTVGRVTFGLADYVLSQNVPHSVAIAYDSRHMSKEFARLAAEIFSSKGVEAYLFDSLMPTPVLSYAVRRLKLGAGVVITASHNPRAYNGYKVYNEKGCQITGEAAEAITRAFGTYDYFTDFTPDEKLIHRVGDDFLDDFLQTVLSYSRGFDKKYLPKIVYTPLNGTGNLPVKKLFEKMGVSDYVVVPEQEYPDGDFTTCPYPNPEEKEALQLALSLAEKIGADLVVATDPDADRMGIATREKDGTFRLFTGNETGVLMENFLLANTDLSSVKSPYVVKTIVTSPLAEKVACSYGVATKNVLTGFKYIGETIDACNDETYLFGMEESYGYLVGTHARDKDAISAVMTLIEAVCYYAKQGKSPSEALFDIEGKLGFYTSALYSKYFEGKSGMEFMAKFMDDLRKNPWKEICGRKVAEVKDYAQGLDGLPKSNVIVCLGEDFSLIARPSGTEPKIKFYVTACADGIAASEKFAQEMVEFVKKSI